MDHRRWSSTRGLGARPAASRYRGNEITAPRDFCRKAPRYEKTVERQHADSRDPLTATEISRQVVLAQAVVDTAPRKVLPDAETFLAALQRAEATGKQIEASPAGEGRGREREPP